MTLHGGVVASLGQGCLILFTIIIAIVMKVAFSRVLGATCLVALVGLTLLLVSALMDDAHLRELGERIAPPGATPRYASPEQHTLLSRTTLSNNATNDVPALDASFKSGSRREQKQRVGEPIYAYCSLVVSAFLLASGCLTVHRRCHSMHLASFLFWLALVGTALALLEMMLFTALWPTSVTTPTNYLPCGAFLLLYNLATVGLHISWRHTPPPVFALVCGLGVLLYTLMQYTLPVLEDPTTGEMRLIALVGAVVLLVGTVFGTVWGMYTYRVDGAQ